MEKETLQTGKDFPSTHTRMPEHLYLPAVNNTWMGRRGQRAKGFAHLTTQEYQPSIWVKVRNKRGWRNIGGNFRLDSYSVAINRVDTKAAYTSPEHQVH